MFTGLVEKISKVENIIINSSGAKISFMADFDNVKLGDSIAVNGVCLTIVEIKNNLFSADVMKETLKLTNLSLLKKGDFVNLERAMKLSDRLDGHIVSGHIDTIAKIHSIQNDGFSKKVVIKCDSELIIKKGSIAINGISLTVSDVFEDGFEVSLIPATIEKTNLSNIKIGDIVNIDTGEKLGKHIGLMYYTLGQRKGLGVGGGYGILYL